MLAGVEPFSIPESEELDNQARKIECGTLVLEPEGTWRDMKKSLFTSSRPPLCRGTLQGKYSSCAKGRVRVGEMVGKKGEVVREPL